MSQGYPIIMIGNSILFAGNEVEDRYWEFIIITQLQPTKTPKRAYLKSRKIREHFLKPLCKEFKM